MNLQDTIYNWLSIKVVANERQDDQAAQDTYEFFHQILTEDHQVSDLHVEVSQEYYIVRYRRNGEEDSKKFPVELIEALLTSIENEPKYNHQ
ncbi:hypothetical protein [Bacillus sp. RAR_GA_16]|uniref:hypothetical protein n=1 Tax=Bacillus sp. RAR_GA_16 TaxID=2876774 RepID=UPI001CC911B6|nr:hypothetical protein [Bacillus sp. RAR_GA_16]MCA0174462.1 hypothetical protein [Bacillus sp. RAR_GA_16]